MSPFLWLLVFVVSLTLLVKSSNWVLKGAREVGSYFHLPPFVTGIILVGLGTSLPELASSLAAVGQGKGEVAVANVIGSNIANIFLVVGLGALLSRHLFIKKRVALVDTPFLLGATAIFLIMAANKEISLIEGVILFSLAVIYLLYYFFYRKKNFLKEEKRKLSKKSLSQLVFGLGGLALGAHYLILALTQLALSLKVSESLIAVTALAIGTSLPELAVSVRAALAKQPAISLGNIFGSNIFNLFLIGGLSAMIRPLPLDSLMMKIGLPFLAVATLAFALSCVFRKIYLWEGVVYLALYLLFIGKVSQLF